MQLVDAGLDVRDGLAGVQVLGAGPGAVHDGVATVQLETVVQELQTLFGGLVAGVLDPAVCLGFGFGFGYND